MEISIYKKVLFIQYSLKSRNYFDIIELRGKNEN